jgi:glycosyltransferase 2 family protein
LKNRVKQALQFIVFFGLGLGLMWWQFSRFTPDQRSVFFLALKTANYGWFALAVIVGAFAHLSRAIRWQQLLTPLGYKVGLGSRFYAVMMAYLANYGLPRSGEVIRCGVLKTSDNVPFSEAFGTVVVERIIDMLCLLLVFVIVLFTQFSEIGELWGKYIAEPASRKFAVLLDSPLALSLVIGGVAMTVFLFCLFRKAIRSRLTGKLGGFLSGFKNGLTAVRRVPKPGWFIFHSLFIWSGYLASLYICLYCFPVTSDISLNSTLILLLFGTFGVAFTPGGIGAYQVLVTSVLVYLMVNMYNVNVTDADIAPFAWLSWGAQVATVVLFCGISLALKPLLNRLSQ